MRKIILVGMMLTLPIFFLMGIFQIGKNIEAAQVIDGKWTITETIRDGDIATCTFAQVIKNDLKFSLQQSGKFIHLQFDQDSLPLLKGKLEGLKMDLTNHEIRFSATIGDDSGLNQMQGEFLFSDCQQPLRFTAIRESLTVSMTGE